MGGFSSDVALAKTNLDNLPVRFFELKDIDGTTYILADFNNDFQVTSETAVSGLKNNEDLLFVKNQHNEWMMLTTGAGGSNAGSDFFSRNKWVPSAFTVNDAKQLIETKTVAYGFRSGAVYPTMAEAVDKIIKENPDTRVFAFGESHYTSPEVVRPTNITFVSEAMPSLIRAGVTDFGFEMFSADIPSSEFTEYFKNRPRSWDEIPPNLKKDLLSINPYMDPTRYKEKMSISKTKSVLPYIRPVYGDNIDPLASIESALSLLITTSALNGHDSYQVLREPV